MLNNKNIASGKLLVDYDWYDLTEETWNYQKDTTYIDEFNTDRFGEKEASLVYPVTLMFNDGELVKEFSYLGYGWSKELSAYKAFINMFVSIKDF